MKPLLLLRILLFLFRLTAAFLFILNIGLFILVLRSALLFDLLDLFQLIFRILPLFLLAFICILFLISLLHLFRLFRLHRRYFNVVLSHFRILLLRNLSKLISIHSLLSLFRPRHFHTCRLTPTIVLQLSLSPNSTTTMLPIRRCLCIIAQVRFVIRIIIRSSLISVTH